MEADGRGNIVEFYLIKEFVDVGHLEGREWKCQVIKVTTRCSPGRGAPAGGSRRWTQRGGGEKGGNVKLGAFLGAMRGVVAHL